MSSLVSSIVCALALTKTYRQEGPNVRTPKQADSRTNRLTLATSGTDETPDDNLDLALRKIKKQLADQDAVVRTKTDDIEADENDDEQPQGPFATTLGEWKPDGGPKPNFQLPMDWHVTSTYTDDENAAYASQYAEAKLRDDATAAGEVGIVGDDSLSTPAEAFEEPQYEHLHYESGDFASSNLVASSPMPKSWQEYQLLQERLAALLEADEGGSCALSASERARASELGGELADFWPTFKKVLAEGWELEVDPCLDEASSLVLKYS